MRKYLIVALASFFPLHSTLAQQCDKSCLEDIANQYRAAYLAHDPGMVAIANNVRFTENNAEMPFPDASWHTVTTEPGPALIFSDVKDGNVAIYTAIIQNDTPGFLAVRLKVENREITEIEHMLSTARNLSGPPTPIGDVNQYSHQGIISEIVPVSERISRDRLAAHAAGYFSTLQLNDGEIRGTAFSDDATRNENGLMFADIKSGFERGFYYFNNKVRHEIIVIDEERQIAMARGFIDHKGALDEYFLTDNTVQRSIYREPHSWGFLEMFKIVDDQIVAVTATFIQAPYNMNTPWSDALNP